MAMGSRAHGILSTHKTLLKKERVKTTKPIPQASGKRIRMEPKAFQPSRVRRAIAGATETIYLA
jgi:hypothetical protein